MSESSQRTVGVERHNEPRYTWQEIFQQPLLWPTTLTRVRADAERLNLSGRLKGGPGAPHRRRQFRLCGGKRGSGVAAPLAVPTTDLLVDAERYLRDVGVVISLARSGNSPESAAVIERVRALCPEIFQLAITCNDDNLLAQSGLEGLIVLDPRTNDRSLVMTGSFSNLVLAGLALAQPDAWPPPPVWRVIGRVPFCLPSINNAGGSPLAPANASLCSLRRPCWAGAGKPDSRFWR